MRILLIALVFVAAGCASKPVKPASFAMSLIPDVPEYDIELTPPFTEEATLIRAGLAGEGTAMKVRVPSWPNASVVVCFDLARLNMWQCVYAYNDGQVVYRSIKPTWDRA